MRFSSSFPINLAVVDLVETEVQNPNLFSLIAVCFMRRKSRDLHLKVRELEVSLKSSSENCVAERQGRIRAQQDLRKALVPHDSDSLELTSYPMAPIAIIQSCFSTRYFGSTRSGC
ncbi:hypothetical protein HHK36_013707 [Tetracentron sinense]|uniref:Uncharacterized protein n=1 Tax=Tetracentron sinense TaxID=13715 RepID=A0A834Z3S2_TETSI|nr:hypothetical protein HHK36_013707 [Tetracentron sinense]